MIYLDNAATTYPKPDGVYDSLDYANRELAFNTGRGSYAVARQATKLLDETRHLMRDLVNAKWKADVIFTPSVTIALNQILNGINFIKGDNIYVSPYEHNAVARVVHHLSKNVQINIIQMPLNESTLEIDLDKLSLMFLKEPPKCICCIHVSNVTGYILPVESIFKMGKRYDAITILDAAQSLGLLEIDAEELYADFIAFAGHKSLYGPLGTGGYINLTSIVLEEFLTGGTGSDSLNLNMPQGEYDQYEPASHNIVAIAGLNAALKELNYTSAFEKDLLASIIEALEEKQETVLYLPPLDRHIGIISFNIKNYKADDVGMILDQDYDIAVRTGYHCAPYIHKWLKTERYSGTVRVSVGRYNTKEDICKFIDAIREL